MGIFIKVYYSSCDQVLTRDFFDIEEAKSFADSLGASFIKADIITVSDDDCDD